MRSLFGTIVASRQLSEPGSGQKVVTVKVGKPRRTKTGDWVCAFQISGLKKSKIEYSYGVDSIQALVLAFEGIRVRLEQSGRQFSWTGGVPGDNGFSRFVPTAFGPKFAKRVEQLIDREVNRFSGYAEIRYRKTKTARESLGNRVADVSSRRKKERRQ